MLTSEQIFFVISNYNTNPFILAEYADDYIIFDQSDDQHWRDLVAGSADTRIRFATNSGTSLINYLTYIIENFETLPPTIAFLKGNVIGRHIPQRRFEKLIKNRHYTYMWYEPSSSTRTKTVIRPQNNNYLELNNSWYAGLSSHRFFTSFDDFAAFLFEDYTPSEYVNFCPGANFIVESSRINQHPKGLYSALRYLLEYSFFPSEAWMVERVFNLIFMGDLTVRDLFFLPEKEIQFSLDQLPDKSGLYVPPPGPLAKLRKLQNYIKAGIAGHE